MLLWALALGRSLDPTPCKYKACEMILFEMDSKEVFMSVDREELDSLYRRYRLVSKNLKKFVSLGD